MSEPLRRRIAHPTLLAQSLMTAYKGRSFEESMTPLSGLVVRLLI